MTGVVRSELLRLLRPQLLLGWFGLVAMFAVLVNFVMFQVVEQGSAAPADGPGVAFPSAATLAGPDGLAAGLGAAASFFGVVTLAFWGLASASDYSTGLVRLLAAAEPRRWRLLVAKWVALAVVTAAVTALAVVVNVVVAPMAAEVGGYTPDSWGTDIVSVVGGAGVQLYASLLVWGSIGLALAVVTRSAGVAIGVGVGYVLVVEAVVSAAASDIGDWLPGSILTALAQGGTEAVSFGAAAASGAAYVAVALAASLLVFQRRDITD